MTALKTSNFINAQAMAAAHPGTFEAPGEADLMAIRPGTFIKVCAEVAGKGERFWVKVKSVEQTFAGPKFTGEVNNDLIRTEFHGLAFGDTVEVAYFEVYAVMG